MEKSLKAVLEKTYTLTGLDDEPQEMILTEAEQAKAVENAIEQKKAYMVWKMKELAYTDPQIKARVKDIDWKNEIDKQSIIAIANANKHQDQWHIKQRAVDLQKQADREKELREKCTAKYMIKLMKWTSRNELGRELIVNNDNTPLIKAICFFLSNDPRFEVELNYSFKKGLLIRGVSGIGKTHLLKCVAANELNPILILSMLEIADEIRESGEFLIELRDKKIIYLDDVGTEEATVNHYGTKINFFKNFAEMYYLKNQIFNKLIISTNNSFAEIEEKYGFRVRSRIKDMFNIVDVTGKDMRG